MMLEDNRSGYYVMFSTATRQTMSLKDVSPQPLAYVFCGSPELEDEACNALEHLHFLLP